MSTLIKSGASFLLDVWIFLLCFQTAKCAAGPKCVNNPNNTLVSVIECIKHDYDKTQRPNGTDGKAIRISVDVVVISIGSLNDVEMDYTIEFYMRQRWIDPLLRYNQKTIAKNGSYAILDQQLINNLWKPDSYVENMKSLRFSFAVGPFVNQGFRLFPNGMVLISTRVSGTLSCKMDFHNFPMDKQMCPITLSSYFFTEADLYYEWGEVSMYKIKNNNQFDIIGIESTRSSLKFTSGVYSSLNVAFKFRRRIQNFLLGFYIPSILTVMLSWVSFFISPNSAPARCALGIITVLAIGGFLTGQRSSFPVVSYVMAADIYILVCYVFTFLALVEYAAVHYFFVYEMQLYQMNKNKNKTKKDKDEFKIDEGEFEPEEDDDDDDESVEEVKIPEPVTMVRPFTNRVDAFSHSPDDSPPPKKRDYFKYIKAFLMCPCMICSTIKRDALVIDKFARVVFPITFGLFNAFYWVIYKLEHNSDVME